ncbi:MAG: DUF2807 domain-containing protein [Sphingomonadales bacterium]
MKIALLCAALLACPVFAAERTLSVTDFDRLRVDGNFTVEVTTGRGTSARVVGTQAAIDATSVVVQGRQMTVRKNTTAWGGYPGQAAGTSIVRITVPALTTVWVTGPAKVSVDRLKGARVSAALEGAGDLSVANVVADYTSLAVIGPGRLGISGTTADVNVTARGAGIIDAGGLKAADAKLTSETAGQVTLSVKRAITGTMTGSGSVTVLGKPACTIKNIGSGSVACGI